MLKSFLLRPKSQKNKRNPQNENSENSNLANVSVSPPPNLIDIDDIFTRPEKYFIRFSNFSSMIILVVSMIFGLMLVYDKELDRSLSRLKAKQDSLIFSLDSFQSDIDLARDVEKKAEFYTQTLSERSPLYSKISVAYGSVQSDAEIISFSMGSSGFMVSLTGKDALVFSRLINIYLRSDLVDHIILHSAAYDKNIDSYKVELEGVFK